MTQAVYKLTLLTNGGIQSCGQSLIARTEIRFPVGRLVDLVRSQMNGLIAFERTLQQTSVTIPLVLKL